MILETAATTKRKSLRATMLEPGCHLVPSCNDGIQARLVEWLGFPLVHISGSGQQTRKGYADLVNKELKELEAKYRY